MITSGVATIYVSDLKRSVQFYAEILGLKVQMHVENKWAQLATDDGFAIGLHPASEHGPKPGASGAISVGLYLGGSMEDAVQRLKDNGVELRCPIVDDGPIRLAFFGDPDGNDLYFCKAKE